MATLIALILTSLVPTALAWEVERPSSSYTFAERTDTNNCTDEAAVGLGIHIGTYNVADPSYGGRDWQRLYLVVTGNTRQIIDYSVSGTSYGWYDLGDDCQMPSSGASYSDDDLLPLGSFGPHYRIRFYGGPKSGEYSESDANNMAYVSTNGFLCFYPLTRDDSFVGSWKTYPYSIPDERGLNAFIAPFWTDLRPDLGGKIKAGDVDWNGRTALCITWENVPDANGLRQTFQLIAVYPASFQQSCIIFQYKQVTPNSAVKAGIECQTGKKGTSYDPMSLSNGTALLLQQTSNYAFLNYLSIKITKATDPAEVRFLPTVIDGYNVKFANTQPDPYAVFFFSLASDVTLLALGAPGVAEDIEMMGFLLGGAVIVKNTVSYLAGAMCPGRGDELTIVDNASVNYATVPVFPSPPSLSPATVVDANMGIGVDWIFGDKSDQEIKVSAQLDYFVTDIYGAIIAWKTIQTEEIPIMLRRDAGNTIDDPYVRVIGTGTYRAYLGNEHLSPDKNDFYKISVPANKILDILLYPPPNGDFDLYLYRPDKTLRASSTNRGEGLLEYIDWFVGPSGDPPGDWYIEARYCANGSGYYTLTVSTSDLGSGCPFLHVWNGKSYAIDNNLIPASEKSGADVQDFYRLEQTPVPLYQNPLSAVYSLQIREFENEHSYLDQVRLMAVDHQPSVNVAVSASGEILTYKNPHAPVCCTDKSGGDVLEAIRAIDQNYYQGYPGDYLTLSFENVNVYKGAKLVLRADANPIKDSIHVQVQNGTGSWQTVAKIIPRVNWATEIVDLAGHLPSSTTTLQIRLYFTAFHKLDYVGLDTTPQAKTTTREALLISAFHSQQGLVTDKLLHNDQTYAELIPNQQISLIFALPRKRDETATTSFIFYTRGHYFTIP